MAGVIAPLPLFGGGGAGGSPQEYFFLFFKTDKDMARKGRPKRKNPSEWNIGKLQALEKKLARMRMEARERFENGEIPHPNKKGMDEDRRAYEEKHARFVAGHIPDVKELIARYKEIKETLNMHDFKSVPDALAALSAWNKGGMTGQILKSREMKTLLGKYDLSDVAGSDEAMALAAKFPVVRDILEAIKATSQEMQERKRAIKMANHRLMEINEGKRPSLQTMLEAVASPDGVVARSLMECRNKDPRCLNPTITMQDMAVLYPALTKHDIFACKPTKEMLLAVIRAEAKKPLRIKNIRLWAYFLDGLYRKNKIGGNWQNAYDEAKAFENSKGVIIDRNTLSRELSKAREDKDTLKMKGRQYGFDEAKDMTQSQRKRLYYYKSVDKAISSL